MSGIGSAGILAGGLTILNNVTCAGTPLLQFAEGYGACFADGTNVNADLSAGNNTLYVRNGEMLSVSGRKTKLPFGNDRPNLKLTMPEFPRNTRPADFKDWVCVDDFGAVGDGKTDSTAAIQKAFNSGKPVILFGEGHYLVNGEITVPSCVNVVDFMFCDLFAGKKLRKMKKSGLFVINEPSDKLLSFENLYTFEQFYGYMRLIKHAAKRELLCRNLHTQTAAMYFNTVKGSTVWFDNCACTTGTYSMNAILSRKWRRPKYSKVIPYEFHGQRIYARNLNPERADTEVLNDNSEFIVYGFKVEGPNRYKDENGSWEFIGECGNRENGREERLSAALT